MIPGSLGHATIRKTRGLHWHNSHSNNIEQSMWLDGSSQYLTRTPSAGNRTRWTLAWWFKLNKVATDMTFFSANSGTNDFFIRMDGTSNQNLTVMDDNASLNVRTTAMQRDAAWYHCIVSLDTNETDEYNRIHIYINGEKKALSTGSAAYPSSGGETYWNNNQANEIGRRSRTTSSYLDAYMAQVVFLNGDSIQNGDCAVSDFLDTWPFGDNGSQFVPKKTSDLTTLATNAGGNSFCLDFADSSAFGNDTSSNNNDFSDAGSPTATNQSSDTPSLAYPKVHEIGTPGGHSAANYTMTSGSNRMVYSGSNQGYFGLTSTQIIQTDDPKIYWEYYLESGSVSPGSGGRTAVGLVAPSFDVSNASGLVGAAGNNPSNVRGVIYDNGSQGSTTADTLVPVGGYGMIAYEPSTGKMWFGLNGTWNNGAQAASTTLNTAGHDHQTTPQDFAFFLAAARSTDITVLNFGDNPTFSGNVTAGTETDENGEGLFKYAVPSGFLAPNSKNLSGPEYQGVDYFNTEIYEGTNGVQKVGDYVPFTDVYDVSNSVIFDDGSSAFLSRTPSGAGNKRTWTWSVWVKRSAVGTEQELLFCGPSSTDLFQSQFHTDDTLIIEDYDGSTQLQRTTNRTFKDTSQWIHLVFVFDTTQSAAADRFKLYVNGQQETSFASSTNPSLNYEGRINAATETTIGKKLYVSPTTKHLDGYMAENVFIDGTALTPSSFGQTDTSTNRWIPKDVSGLTFGTNGWYLDMAIAPGTGNGAGNDVSGNNNDFTESGFAAGDQTTDTPSNNKAVLDTLTVRGTISEGGLKTVATGNEYQWAMSTLPIPKSGKWVFEAQSSNIDGSSRYGYIGIAQRGAAVVNSGTNYQYGINLGNGEIVTNNRVITDIGAGPTTSVMRIEYDADIDQIKIYDDNSLIHTGHTNLTGHSELHFFVAPYASGTDFTVKFTDFTHTPTTGFKALIQDNLDGTDDKITAFAWIKNRDATDSHILVDRVRGVNKVMHTDVTDAETTEVNTIQRFLQRGVQVGNDVQVNTADEGYVLWQWLLGTSASTGSTTSPAGTIASTSLVTAADHFSIVTYTGNQTSGATFGHGLSGAPEMVIVKERDPGGNNWMVGHDAMGWGKYLAWDTDASPVTSSARWNDTAPSSTLVTLGNDTGINATGATYVAYCFRSVPGVCKVDSYHGNGLANGPYVQCGFKPAWVMTKNINDTEHWIIQDNVRQPNNQNDEYLSPSQNIAAATGLYVDFLADGFKLRSTSNMTNGGSGDEMIYLAMAEVAGQDSYPPIYGV